MGSDPRTAAHDEEGCFSLKIFYCGEYLSYTRVLNGNHCAFSLSKAIRKFLSEEAGLGPERRCSLSNRKSFRNAQSLPRHPTALWAPLAPFAAHCCNCHSISGKTGPKWETLWTTDRTRLLMRWLWRKPNQGTCSFSCLLPSPSLPTHAPSQWNVSLFPSLNFTRQQKN